MNKTKEPYVTQKAFSGLVDFFSRAVVEHKASESWKKKNRKKKRFDDKDVAIRFKMFPTQIYKVN